MLSRQTDSTITLHHLTMSVYHINYFTCFHDLGYGSCEVAGDDAVALSYVIAATRPAGGILLTLLFLAILKPLVIGLIH